MIAQPAQVDVFFPEQPFGGVLVETPDELQMISLHQGSPGPPGPQGPPGPGSDAPLTINLLEGDGVGGMADSGVAVSEIVLKQEAYATPTTLNQVIQCLKDAGLCAP